MANLPTLVRSQLPEFVREDHPAFVEFVKAYYEWMESESLGKIESLVDIDNTVDDYVKYFKSQLDINGPEYPYISPRLFLKNSKNLFTAKGSEASIKFLLNILYGKPSEVITPWDLVFIPSEGKWHEDISIFVETVRGSAADLTGKYIDITGTDGKVHRAFVTSVLKYSETVYELFLDKFRSSHIVAGSPFVTLDLSTAGTLLRTTTHAKVDIPGQGFEVGQLFAIDGFSGSGSLLKIKSVDLNGGITAVQFIQFGVDYNKEFTVNIFPEAAITKEATGSINLVLDLFDGTYPTTDTLNNSSEKMLMTKHNYTSSPGTYETINAFQMVPGGNYIIDTLGDTDFTEYGAPSNTVGIGFTANAVGEGTGTVLSPVSYFTDPTYVGSVEGEFKSQPSAKTKVPGGDARLRIYIGCFAKYPGYYLDGTSLISDQSYVQDSYYYQKFSYATAIEETLEEYKEILKKTLHPIGMELFGKYQIVNNFNINIDVDPSLNFIDRGEPSRETIITDDLVTLQIGKNVFDDTSGATDNIASFDVNKYLTDTATQSDTGVIETNPYVDRVYWVDGYFESDRQSIS